MVVSLGSNVLFFADGKNSDQLSKLGDSLRQKMKVINSDDPIIFVVELRSVNPHCSQPENVVELLKSQAAYSQRSLLEFLSDERDVQILNSFWLVNAVLVNATVSTLQKLAKLDMVEKVYENFELNISESVKSYDSSFSISMVDSSAVSATWGLNRIQVPEAWTLGYNGSGIRVCVLDTGVEMSHSDLQGKMWTDNPADPTSPGGWIEFDSSGNIIMDSTPYDTASHGTHTSGTVLGENQSGVAIGVAPGASLMHGMILPGGSGTFTQCIAGMQWAIEPFDQYGNPAGEKASVVSMSWTADGHHEEMIEPIQNMVATGVVPVVSIGNGGEGSTGSPGNVYESFAIGATDSSDIVAGFSSGAIEYWPVSYPDSYVKPDFSAPGVSVYSSVSSGGYEYWSGTSMAAPHVAGTVALMLQANSNLSVNDVYEVLRTVADDLGDAGMDPRYGWGIINTYEAVGLALDNCGVEGYVTDLNTAQPLEWAAQVTVYGVSWGTKNTGSDGSYRIWLYPDNYAVSASAFGYSEQNVTAQVVGGLWSELNFSLEATPRGIVSGVVTNLESGSAISNATVELSGTPLLPAFTNSTGHYSLDVPVGIFTFEFWAWGFKPAIVTDVTVLENQTIIVNMQLSLTIKVAVLGDFNGQLVDLLMRNISAQERDWDVIQDIYDYDAIIVNSPLDPGEQVFTDLIDSADQYDVSLIFTNSYPGPWWSFGISLLQRYSGNPESSYFAYWSGNVYVEVVSNHPIFDGWNIGDRITVIEGGDYDFAWFNRYSGTTIADIGSESLGPLGNGIAYTVSGQGNVHLLLGGLAPNIYTHIDNGWTEEAKRLFRASVIWACEPTELAPASITVDPGSGSAGAKVNVNGFGFAVQSKVTVKFDDMPIATTDTDVNGSFAAVFNVPVSEPGPHLIKALDDYGHRAEVSYVVIPSSGPGEARYLTVTVKVGSIYLRGESAAFHILTTLNGVPIDVDIIDVKIFKPDRTSELVANVREAAGFYTVAYEVGTDEPTGTYTLIVEANVNGVNGSSIGSFLVSQTLNGWNAALVSIEEDLAIIQTDIGNLRINLSNVDAKISTVTNDVATIETSVGKIEVDVQYAISVIESTNSTILKIEGDVATIKTEIGEIKGIISAIQDDIATIETELGQIRMLLPTSGGTPLGMPSISVTDIGILMLLAAIATVVTALVWSGIASKPRFSS
jgi:subtilisin family serine protease/archaellum component FlaC